MGTGKSIKNILAREWLTLIVGFLAGFPLVLVIYTFISPADYTSHHSLIDVYKELISIFFGEKGSEKLLTTMAIILSPYLVYQFTRSVLWAIKTIREN
jgi:uncharacterized membrane protein